MLSTETWIILVFSIIIAGLIGFALGRRQTSSGAQHVKEMEQQLAQKELELEAYQQKVHEHYNKTANLFKDMAGSYKELFDHLSVGYEQLGDPSEQRVLPKRAGALLDGKDIDEAITQSKDKDSPLTDDRIG